MKQYKIIMLVPDSIVIEAPNLQVACDEARKMAHINNTDGRAVPATIHSVEEVPGSDLAPVDDWDSPSVA